MENSEYFIIHKRIYTQELESLDDVVYQRVMSFPDGDEARQLAYRVDQLVKMEIEAELKN